MPKGVSTGDFTEVLEALLDPNARGLSAMTITRRKADWWTDYEEWQKRELGNWRFLQFMRRGHFIKPRDQTSELTALEGPPVEEC